MSKDGDLVAVLMTIDNGDSFTVVTEVYAPGPDGHAQVVRRCPYTFPSSHEGYAFLGETVTTFTYLGCDVRKQ